nr:alpha/beta hydrolase [Pseudomonas sp. CG7]
MAWNEEDRHKPAILLAHGYRAHAHWWDFIAPFFCENYRVFALDFCGMGDSEWRPTYSAETFVDELRAVIEHAGLSPVTLIGHSYGGTRVLRACTKFAELIERAIVVDSFVAFIDSDEPATPRQYGGHFYPDADSAIQRFRLLPEQPVHDWARAYIARHSLRKAKQGWTWKFDPDLPYAIFERDGEALLREIRVPLDMVCGEHSVVMDGARARRVGEVLAAQNNARGPVIIPDAYHHLMLDQPLALISTLRALLA